MWIYSQFLISIDSIEPASYYADDAVKNFEQLKIHDYRYYDAQLIFGISEIKLYQRDNELPHLRNALKAQKAALAFKNPQQIVGAHLKELENLLTPYACFSV